jgi:hypothetical protein
MRIRPVALALLASVVLPAAASAAQPPPNVLFAGTIPRTFLQNGSGSWCLFEGTNTTFLKTASSTLISFPDIVFAPTGSVGPGYYTIGGQGEMKFNDGSTTAGRIVFTPVTGYPPAINKPIFNLYHQVYDTAARTLTVSFTIHLNGCLLPVSATYRN